ncbi:MAG: N-acetylmuramoyl-L-alanine amidase [Myxococcota bacterium]
MEVYPSMTRVKTDPADPCKPEQNAYLNRMVIRVPGYTELTDFNEVAQHEVLERKWCGPGGHYYVENDGRITQGRPETMKGANEVRGTDGNTNKLGIQVFEPSEAEALSADFIGNLTQLIHCKMIQLSIWPKNIKPHFNKQFRPSHKIVELVNHIVSNATVLEQLEEQVKGL